MRQRVFAVGAIYAVFFAGCAAIAGIADPTPVPDGPAVDAATGPLPEANLSVEDADASGAPDARVEAEAEAGPACVDAGADAACASDLGCCASRCSEDHRCRDACRALGGSCSSSSVTSCCVGLYCAPKTSTCAVCVPPGGRADYVGIFFPTPIAHSCCSRQLDGGTCL